MSRPPFSIPAESIPGCMFGANWVILVQIYDELSRGQAKFPRILSQNGQNDLEGQGQWPPFSIPAESIPWCMLGANLVIPAQICDKLSCGQAKVYGQTDGNENTPSAWNAKGQKAATVVRFKVDYKQGGWCHIEYPSESHIKLFFFT